MMPHDNEPLNHFVNQLIETSCFTEIKLSEHNLPIQMEFFWAS